MKSQLLRCACAAIVLASGAASAAELKTGTAPARIAPTPLELWRAEVAKLEAEVNKIEAELTALQQQRPSTPVPFQSQSRLRTSSLQPSGSLPGSRASQPTAPNFAPVVQRLSAAQTRLAQARQQVARLEIGTSPTPSPRIPAPTPATSSTPPAKPNDAELAARFAALPAMKDDFVEPPLPISNPDPSYSETIEFINSRLPDEGKIGFGRNLRKMILRGDGEVFVFDPKELNPEVKSFTSKTEVTPFGNYSECKVVLAARNSRDVIQHWYDGVEESQMWQVMEIRTADEVETKKLAKAFQHLIQMFGGKKEAF